MATRVLSRQFRAMCTRVELYVRPEPEAAARAEAELGRWEEWFRAAHRALTRFDPDSELSRLNRAPGRYHVVSPLLGRVLAAALAAARRTGGLFDPTVLPALVAAGYDRSLDPPAGGEGPGPPPAPAQTGAPASPPPGAPPVPAGGWHRVRVVPLSDGRYVVDRPEGVQFDLGGIAKGWAADRAARALARFGPAAAGVGGDLRVVIPPSARRREPDLAWPVAVADPFRPERTLLRLALAGGAVCTSDTLGRRWRQGARWHHHIVDPRTGRPADAGAVAATVIAPRAELAEALTKGCLLLGPGDAVAWAGSYGALAVVVAADGSIRMSRELEGIAHARVV